MLLQVQVVSQEQTALQVFQVLQELQVQMVHQV